MSGVRSMPLSVIRVERSNDAIVAERMETTSCTKLLLSHGKVPIGVSRTVVPVREESEPLDASFARPYWRSCSAAGTAFTRTPAFSPARRG